MTGRIFVGGFLGLVIVLGAVLFYTQVYAFYDRVEGISQIDLQGQPVPVTDYRGIDASTSPLKIRGCFTVNPEVFAAIPAASDATPLAAPRWFECFDFAALTRDIDSGAAIAYVAGDETPATGSTYEILRYVAVYPDGRAFLWRQYNKTE